MSNTTLLGWHALRSSSNLTAYVLSNPAFYHVERPQIFSSISDASLSLLAPILAYWIYSLFFHFLDTSDFKFLQKYRIHDSKEVQSRNAVTVREVVVAVIFQQAVQTVLGVFLLEETARAGTGWFGDVQWVSWLVDSVMTVVFGRRVADQILEVNGPRLVWWTFWWGIPFVQIIFGFFVIDTWQYFLHRLFHVNKFLYRNFHSVHHRLYVPYAFGALYNHPVEGFLLDSCGAAIAHEVSLLTIRQAILLFTFSTLKTVDDHCGYRLPFDPLQIVFGNNADYHDIHHQKAGIKSNFSQPFFIHWDVFFGTRMSREALERRVRDKKE